MSKEALQIGAGRIGKGLNGAVLSEAGYGITFADVSQEQIDLLNKHREYPVYTVSSSGRNEQMVRNVDGVNIQDIEAFAKAVVDADIILTAVGSNILPKIAPALAQGLVERIKRRPKDELHAVVVACENITDNTTLLKRHVLDNVPEEYKKRIEDKISFPNCVVDRIVPASTSAEVGVSPLAVTVEDYYQWVVDATALKGAMPVIPGIQLSDDLPAVLEQKLFTLNMAHALTAYFGHRKGHQYIHEAVADPMVRVLVEGALDEVELVITGRNQSITSEGQKHYAQKILSRFENPYLQDEVTRVAREPKRKLGATDRLVQPAIMAVSQGVNPAHLTAGITGALTYRNPDDVQSAELQSALTEKGVELVMLEVTQLQSDNPVVNMVRAEYHFDMLS